MAREDEPGEKWLVAYVVGHDGAPGTSALRDHLRVKLPDYMVPSVFVTLDTLPLTPNGKVDRKALPAPTMYRQEDRYVAPRTPIEEGLAEIWQQVLRLEQVGIHDSFFELGGHSLLATQVISRVRATFQVELPLRALFEAPTIAGLAERIDAARGAEIALAPPLVRVSREGRLPLSFSQQRLWFLDQFEPGSAAYNMPGALRLTGSLNVEALQASLQEIVRRHEALRTTFQIEEGVPAQVISETLPTLDLVDLSALPAVERESEARRLAGEEARRPFDLEHRAAVPFIAAEAGRRGACPAHDDAPYRLGRLVDGRAAPGTGRALPCLLGGRAFAAAGADAPVRRLRGLAARVAAGRGAGAPGRLLEGAACGRADAAGTADRPAATGGADFPGCASTHGALCGPDRGAEGARDSRRARRCS